MRVRVTQKRSIEQRALVPNVNVALPREADSAVQLEYVARNLHGGIRDVRLRQSRHARGFARNVVKGMRRVPVQAAGRLQFRG